MEMVMEQAEAVQCQHHWVVEQRPRLGDIGICQKCGAIKRFSNRTGSRKETAENHIPNLDVKNSIANRNNLAIPADSIEKHRPSNELPMLNSLMKYYTIKGIAAEN